MDLVFGDTAEEFKELLKYWGYGSLDWFTC